MTLAKLPETSESVHVRPLPIEIALSDDPTLKPLILPPLEDIREIDSLRGKGYSVALQSQNIWSALGSEFAHQLEQAESRTEQFHDAPAHYFRLADLALLAGDRDREHGYLERAGRLGHHDYALRRIGENLIAKGDGIAAELVFRSLDLGKDDYANLRLAYFHVQRQEIREAQEHVSKAVQIEPLSFSVRLFEGALFLALGENQRAIRSLRVANEIRPNSSALQTNMALAFIRLAQPEKAMLSLRKAVAIDPLNKNAIALLADYSITFKLHTAEAVPALRYYLQLEQKAPEMWERLARALLMLGENLEALAAFKRQASLIESSAVWNNLGAVYWKLAESDKSRKAFLRAIELAEKTENVHDILFASRSLALSLVKEGRYKATKLLVSQALKWDRADLALSDRVLSDLHAAKFLAHVKLGEMPEVGQMVSALLSNSTTSLHLRAWVVTASIDALAREHGQIDEALKLVDIGNDLLRELGHDKSYDLDRQNLANNIAYLYAEAGQLDDAQHVMAGLLGVIHRNPFATATLGLINFKKGHIGRGVKLYQSAHRMASSPEIKRHLRQKLNLELGRALQLSDPTRALKALQKAFAEKEGVSWFRHQAFTMLAVLERGLPSSE